MLPFSSTELLHPTPLLSFFSLFFVVVCMALIETKRQIQENDPHWLRSVGWQWRRFWWCCSCSSCCLWQEHIILQLKKKWQMPNHKCWITNAQSHVNTNSQSWSKWRSDNLFTNCLSVKCIIEEKQHWLPHYFQTTTGTKIVYVGVCLCMNACVSVHACMYVCMYVWVCLYACVRVCVCVCVCKHACAKETWVGDGCESYSF